MAQRGLLHNVYVPGDLRMQSPREIVEQVTLGRSLHQFECPYVGFQHSESALGSYHPVPASAHHLAAPHFTAEEAGCIHDLCCGHFVSKLTNPSRNTHPLTFE